MTTRREFMLQTAAAGVAAGAASSAALGAVPARPSGGFVETVLGRIPVSRLGFTSPHEHLIASSTGFLQAWPEFFGGRAVLAEKIVRQLKAAKAGGIDTLVDVTPIDVGRDVRLMAEVSRASGVQIVCCTGHWHSPSLSMQARTADELARFFTLEIERGIDGTAIKPGVIKVATDREGITPFLENALRAAARVSKATGVPVTTHTYAAGRGGEQQAAIFEQEGLSPQQVCLGHSDESADLGYLTGLAERGYTLGMDHLFYGLASMREGTDMPSWEQRADTIKQLIDRGFSDRLFLATDWFFGVSMADTGTMDVLDQRNPDGVLFNLRKTIPRLRDIGVTDAQIRQITVGNPARFFARRTA